jgi:hypothetical protein
LPFCDASRRWIDGSGSSATHSLTTKRWQLLVFTCHFGCLSWFCSSFSSGCLCMAYHNGSLSFRDSDLQLSAHARIEVRRIFSWIVSQASAAAAVMWFAGDGTGWSVGNSLLFMIIQ